jgi:cell division protein FtsA
VLTRDEKELGAALIDIGGGTTDIALYAKNSIRFTSVLPLGGEHFTRDLAVGLRTPIEEAERIKKDSGAVSVERIGADEQLKIPGVGTRGERDETRRFVCEILHARAAELLDLIKDQIDRAGGRSQLVAGVVLTGGGSLLEGLQEMAEEALGLPVRLGLPQSPSGLTEELSHPVYSTAVGLAIFDGDEQRSAKKRGAKSGATPWLFNRFVSWVIE